MPKILLLENPHTVADETFHHYGYEVQRISGSLDEDDLIEALAGVDIVGIRSKTQVTEKVLEAARHLTAVGTFSIGTNQIDLPAAAERGIAVFNAPYSNTRSVVELVIAEAVMLTRHVPEHDKNLQLHKWNKTAKDSHELRGKTMGIIGYHSIGTQLSVVAEAMGMNVIFYDIAERLAIGNAHRAKNLDELLAASDVVTLHIDGRPSNTGFFSREMFDKMKKGAIFINLARGLVYDVDALREKLLDGSLTGAGVDVYPEEPRNNQEPFNSPLLGIPNTILTPHIGGSTLEAQEDIGRYVSDKLMKYIATGSTEMSVNIPNVTVPAEQPAHRLAWIHHNTPGALTKVNSLFSDEGINVVYQTLATEGELGYMIIDTSSPITPEALADLEKSSAHIRARVIR
ncbi:MAG: phosphoglycerate dehydrogenase [Actinomycetaceae bacterium]|nr:phosphoglycerate dehydrogenase [Arcanobacterium sp.]MDD7687347.1 phosphoglycerate dehydrogenase [Actinomycetaceae bacterium]MDY5274117.1 phosphoglycerate dehydrogenase [Arcanobacterium sp.]